MAAKHRAKANEKGVQKGDEWLAQTLLALRVGCGTESVEAITAVQEASCREVYKKLAALAEADGGSFKDALIQAHGGGDDLHTTRIPTNSLCIPLHVACVCVCVCACSKWGTLSLFLSIYR